METREIVAANIRARMAWHGVSAPELARRLGMKTRTLQSKLYDGVRITVDELDRIAAALNTTPGDLFIAVFESAWTRILRVAA